MVMPKAPTPKSKVELVVVNLPIKRDDEWEMEIIMSDGRIVTRTLGGKKTYESAWEYGKSITTPHGHQLIGIRRAGIGDRTIRKITKM